MSLRMRLALRVRFLLSSELFTPRTGRDEEDGEEEMVLLLFCFPGFTFKRAVYTLIKLAGYKAGASPIPHMRKMSYALFTGL